MKYSLFEIEAGMCKWPHGDGPYTFCGAQIYREGCPYCAEHAARSYYRKGADGVLRAAAPPPKITTPVQRAYKTWPPARSERLLALWQAGLTATQIAKEMDATKGYVIGRINRLRAYGDKRATWRVYPQDTQSAEGRISA